MSRLYNFCLNGDVQRTREILQIATLEEINRSESDGSTPLHVACRQNHKQIVELLLERGAVRRTMNENGWIPIDETSNQEIKQLFNVQRLPLKSVMGRTNHNFNGHSLCLVLPLLID